MTREEYEKSLNYVFNGEQQPCDDAIGRQAAIDAIYARYIGGKEAVDKAPASDHYAEGIDEAVCAVEDLPPVTPQQKTGHWIYSKAVNTSEIIWSECSECKDGERGCAKRMKYCPNCGCAMKGKLE